jgi:metal-responsive CopG/Arc/MetJ family transcriptional regulator
MGKSINFKPTMVYLYKEDNEHLDTKSTYRGYKSEFIRQAVREKIEKEKRQEKRDGK